MLEIDGNLRQPAACSSAVLEDPGAARGARAARGHRGAPLP